MVPDYACWRYNQWIHTCWQCHPSYWSERRPALNWKSTTLTSQMQCTMRCFLHIMPNLPPTAPTLRHSVKKDALIYIKKWIWHGLPLTKFMVLWYSLSIFWIAAQLKIWCLQLPCDSLEFGYLQSNAEHLSSWGFSQIELRIKIIYWGFFWVWFGFGFSFFFILSFLSSSYNKTCRKFLQWKSKTHFFHYKE